MNAFAVLANSCSDISKLMNKAASTFKELPVKEALSSQCSQLICSYITTESQVLDKMLDNLLDRRIEELRIYNPSKFQKCSQLCVTSFSCFITAAVSGFRRLDIAIGSAKNASCSEGRLQLFAHMWQLLCRICEWVSDWQTFGTGEFQMDPTLIEPALLTLMIWLRDFIRDDSSKHHSLKAFKIKGPGWKLDIYKLVDPALCLLENISLYDVTNIGTAMNSLPVEFISTLCCLVCDAAPERSSDSSNAEALACNGLHHTLMCSLGDQIGDLVENFSGVYPQHVSCTKIACKASLEVVKRLLCRFIATPTSTSDSSATLLLKILNNLSLCLPSSTLFGETPTNRPCYQGQIRAAHVGSSKGSSSRSSSNTSRSSSNANTINPHLDTYDHKLLSFLIPWSFTHSESVFAVATVINRLVSGWKEEETAWLNFLGLYSLADVLKFSSLHLCTEMQHRSTTVKDYTKESLTRKHFSQLLLESISLFVDKFAAPNSEWVISAFNFVSLKTFSESRIQIR